MIAHFLFMKGNAAKESAVWELLRRLRKLVTEESVHQTYLEYNRIPHTIPPEFEFWWGARASKETSKMQILHFVTKIQNKDPREPETTGWDFVTAPGCVHEGLDFLAQS
uniref:MAGE domain-containing protein n=1 Tax=Gopherus evgoodei TaxID=1825980 RepID=A0A8C4WSY0_9SAUR